MSVYVPEQKWPELTGEALASHIKSLERQVAHSQSLLAAARKAQKNQKRAAKDRKNVNG